MCSRFSHTMESRVTSTRRLVNNLVVSEQIYVEKNCPAFQSSVDASDDKKVLLSESSGKQQGNSRKESSNTAENLNGKKEEM